MTKIRLICLTSKDCVEMLKANPEWEMVSFHYEELHPVGDCRVILAAPPHDSEYLKELAEILGADQIEDPRVLLANGVVEQADELAFIVRSFIGHLGLMVLTKKTQESK
jgi:hypothetical protein